MQEITGNDLNPNFHDMKKLDLIVLQAELDELQQESTHKRKIKIATSNSFIIAERINTEEPDIYKVPLLDKAILKSEDTTLKTMQEGSVVNLHAMIVLNNVKIMPFSNPDVEMECESFAIYTDHIMGITLTD
ncbi:hypothetical protein [Bacillus sp. SG-1]|uniref:hypothetical protein n=1 Tax=Bacillus sp. SG-1 TaxID=161544 RepID=UPI0001543397|nr:hypothetical protein [Bacillus sp. SG-1]EDL66681.1 hypothetical protein BSG1_04975 [Bacillus sp. SG-1]